MEQKLQIWKILPWLAVVLLTALSYVFLLSPRLTALHKQDTQISTEKNTTLVEQQKLDALRKLTTDQKTEIKQQESVLEKQLPDNVADADFFKQVRDARAKAGVNVSNITVGADDANSSGSSSQSNGSGAVAYNVSITGTGNNVTQFLDNLQGMNRLLLIRSVNLTYGGNTSGSTSTNADSGVSFVIEGAIYSTDTTSSSSAASTPSS